MVSPYVGEDPRSASAVRLSVLAFLLILVLLFVVVASRCRTLGPSVSNEERESQFQVLKDLRRIIQSVIARHLRTRDEVLKWFGPPDGIESHGNSDVFEWEYSELELRLFFDREGRIMQFQHD